MGSVVVVGMAVAIGVAVGELVTVGVGVAVAVADALLVAVAVVVADAVAAVVGVGVDGEAVGVSVVVAVATIAVMVDVGLLVAVGVPVVADEAVAIGVVVSVGDGVSVAVNVGDGVSVAVNVGVPAVVAVVAPAGVLGAVAVSVDMDVAVAVAVAMGVRVVVAVGMTVAVPVAVFAAVVVAVAMGMLVLGVGATGMVVAVGAAGGMAGGAGVVVLVGVGVAVADVVTNAGSGVFARVCVSGVAIMTGAVVGGKGSDDGGTVAAPIRAGVAVAVREGARFTALAVAVARARGREVRLGAATLLAPLIVCRAFVGRAARRPDGTGQRGPPRPKARCAPAPRPAFSTRRVPLVALPVRWASVTAMRIGRSWLRRCVSVNACVRLSIRIPNVRPVDIVRAVTRAIRCALQHPDSWKAIIVPFRRRAGPPIAHRKVIAVAGGRGDRRTGVDSGATRPLRMAPDGRAPVAIGCV